MAPSLFNVLFYSLFLFIQSSLLLIIMQLYSLKLHSFLRQKQGKWIKQHANIKIIKNYNTQIGLQF